MSKYLCREGNVFLFRRRVPERLWERLGQKEIYRSLKTPIVREARQRAAALFLASERLFAMADVTELTDEDIQAAARHWLAQAPWQETIARSVYGRLPGQLRRDGDTLADRLLETGAEGIPPLDSRQGEASLALESAGYPMPPYEPELLDRTAAALADMLRQIIDQRMQEVFRPEETAASASVPANIAATITPSVKTPLVSEHVKEWQKALVSGWKNVKPIDPHSAKQYGVGVRLFVEIIGDRRFGDITYDDAESFRDQLLRLSNSHGKGRHVHALEAIRIAATEGVELMKMKTAKRHNTAMNRYWEWLVFKGRIPRSPSPFLDHKFPGTRSSSRDREAWSAEQLEHLFKSTDYRSHARDRASHWLPLISLHSGMRLEEICRLRPADDIELINGIACFVIQKHPDGWDPKTEAGERKVPIHPWLIEHGLLKLVERRRSESAPRVFPELPLQGGKLGAQFSRDFSRFKMAFGYGRKHVFHSFRHTFRTELENTTHKDAHINAVMGHEGGNRGEGRTYVKGISVTVLANVVKSFRSPLPLDFIDNEGMPVRPVRVRKVRLQPRVTA